MDITINLASQPYQQVQRFLLRWRLLISAVTLLALALLCGSVAACLSWYTIRTQAAALQRQIDKYDRRKAEAEAFLNRPGNRQIRQRAGFLNALIARKAFSWTEVFTDLEQIMPPGLHVTSIHPEVTNDDQLELHLTVAGSKRVAAIELVRRLEQSSHFAQALIQDEATRSPQNTQTPGDLVQYNITATYIPGFAREKPGRERDQTPHAATGLPEAASSEHEIATEARNAGH